MNYQTLKNILQSWEVRDREFIEEEKKKIKKRERVDAISSITYAVVHLPKQHPKHVHTPYNPRQQLELGLDLEPTHMSLPKFHWV